MDETSVKSGSSLTDKSLAVALITLARYLADKDAHLGTYLQKSLEHARASNLQESDLAALKLVIGAIGSA